MRFIEPEDVQGGWDVILVGSGFGSLFYLKKHLALRPTDRALILEWGGHKPLAEQRIDGRNSDISPETTFRNEGTKTWNFTIGLGGGTNCWWGLSPRLHPSDFRLQTLYGVGVDWPISYEDLIPYFAEAEDVMSMAGPDDMAAVYPGAGRYPLPPHRLSTVDRMLKANAPQRHFAIPCARLSQSTGERGRCCSTGTCNLCPTGAKFFALNAMDDVLSHPGVSICINAKVERFVVEGGRITRAAFTRSGREHEVAGDLFVNGANAIQAPFILQRSGIEGPALGRYLGEKIYASAEAKLDGIKHFDGGTFTTGLNTTLIDGPHRAERGGAALLVENGFEDFGLRADAGRWRELLPIGIYVEDILQEENGVFDEGGDIPVVRFSGFTEYALEGLRGAVAALPDVLSALPIESIEFKTIHPTIAHLQGTMRMGASPDASVVDAGQVHHVQRNLVVVGTSVFPTTSSANVSLTAAAMSLRAAEKLVG